MRYFKKIFTELLPAIQKEITIAIPIDESQSYTYVNYNPEDILVNTPILSGFLINLGLRDKVQAFASITAGPGFLIIPHKDGHKGSLLQSKIALNIPVANYMDSVTGFYTPNIPNIDEVLPEKQSRFGYKYRPYTYEYLDQVASLTVDSPSFLRIDEIHDVKNNSSGVRHVLSIRFSPDPEGIFDDNH